jgi:hypothetical protein
MKHRALAIGGLVLGVLVVGGGVRALVTLAGALRTTAKEAPYPRQTATAPLPSTGHAARTPENAAVSAITNDGPAPRARGSSRRHHRHGAPREREEMPLELVATQLQAEVDAARPQMERCLRGTPAGRAGGGDDSRAIARVIEKARLLHGKPFAGEEEALLRDLEAAATAAGNRAGPRTIVLDVETGEGEVRIIGVPPASNGSLDDPLLICAERELGGKVIPVAGVEAGSRVPVAVPLGTVD